MIPRMAHAHSDIVARITRAYESPPLAGSKQLEASNIEVSEAAVGALCAVRSNEDTREAALGTVEKDAGKAIARNEARCGC